ncbi:hydrolase [Chania multitudinisentens RB-25]|uniref:Hydrolase n=1 Tax=Chania multitudinisentens RB-25 TaxID=1441930 RepID=W0LG64_9GAMM|nr:phosphotriesterase-related protein [Chania multitudinisentens]AHG20925.1 hydrolase [Chania multitudinisentens RB-25]
MINPTGYTYVHEHLHIDLSHEKNNIDCRFDQYELIRDELKVLKQKGVANIVEMTNHYMGRNAQFMLDLMRDTGMNVLASTGFYQQKFYPDFIASRTAPALAKIMIDEIEQGIDGTALKASVIAEIGSSKDVITQDEKKVFHAAVLAHQATGRPLSTHTTLSTMGVEQVGLLKQLGMDLNHVVIGHCDLKEQLDNILQMIDAGAYVQFDTIGKNDYFPDQKRIEMLQALQQRGLLNRVMLSMDLTRRSHLKVNGGLGFSYLLDQFVPMLLNAGFSQTEIELMLKENPKRFFG